MARRFMTARPLLGSLLAGVGAFALFFAISVIAGEGAGGSLAGGLFLGIAVGGALALAHLMSRRHVR